MSEEQIEARAMVNGFLMLGFEEKIANMNYAKKCATFSMDRLIDFLNSRRSFIDPENFKGDMEFLETVKKEIQSI